MLIVNETQIICNPMPTLLECVLDRMCFKRDIDYMQPYADPQLQVCMYVYTHTRHQPKALMFQDDCFVFFGRRCCEGTLVGFLQWKFSFYLGNYYLRGALFFWQALLRGHTSVLALDSQACVICFFLLLVGLLSRSLLLLVGLFSRSLFTISRSLLSRSLLLLPSVIALDFQA